MEINKPLFSIIITILNGGKTLENTLKSIADQTFIDYEVILVDGGSTDDTIDVIEKSNIVNKILKVVPGAGLYEGLNIGVRLASGSWLYFIGCDDKLYNNDTLKIVSQFINNKNNAIKVFVGNVECVKQENILYARFGSPHWMHYQVHHQGMFYDKNLFENSNYNENMRIASDYEFNLQLALNNIPHHHMDIITCSFGGDGVSENQMKRGAVEMQQVHKRLFNGIPLLIALASFSIQHNVVLFRKRYKLVNLKARFRKFISV
jgi:glycosyltransferase involved in cell wall biosynthesis